MIILKRIFYLGLFLMVSTSCSQKSTNEINVNKEISTKPTSEINFVIPTPEANTGVVFGKILNSIYDEPVTGIPYLVKNLSSGNPEIPPTISFSYQSDPRAIFNLETGDFYFKDIEPAENYVIILVDGPGSIIVIREDNSEYPLMIEVQPDESIDLGTITLQEP